VKNFMFKLLVFMGFIFIKGILAADTSPQQLAYQSEESSPEQELNKRLLHAQEFALFAIAALNNELQAAALNEQFKQKFEEKTLEIGSSPLVALRSIATKEEAKGARSYYLGVRDNLSAITILLAFEAMALKASGAENDEAREALNNLLSQNFDVMKEILKDGPGIPDFELRSIGTKDNAIAARAYYAGIKDNLLGRTEAMGKGESF
jgi:hypothetical protein